MDEPENFNSFYHPLPILKKTYSLIFFIHKVDKLLYENYSQENEYSFL